jgi:hypothetical protein
MKIKNYIVAVAVLCSVLAVRAQSTFTQITNSPVVNDAGQFVGAVWGDFHNSGFQDLIVCNYASTNVYYRNNGDGTFTKISQGEPIADAGYHIGAVAGDYDNDGHLDLCITAGAYAPSAATNRLYHNNGDGTFSLASGTGVTSQPGHFGPGVWADYDNDGFLDLFVANHGLANDNGWKNQLFHNKGDGTFTSVINGAIVNDISVGFCAAWEDYDNDGFVDLLVVNNVTGGANMLYHNDGHGTFTRVTTNIIATDAWPGGASTAAWGDYDNDGLPDLYITDQAGVRCQLYHNSGNGAFTRITSGPELVPSPGGAFNGCAWGDCDNDGYLDLFVSGAGETNALFHNNGDGTFTKILATGPPVNGGGANMVYGAVSWVDYDNDGFLDLFVGGFTTNDLASAPGKNLLYHNDGNSNAWLEVKLVGTVANRSAIGAKVRVHATIDGKNFWQLREINGGGGYNSAPLIAHFGLGEATNADTLRIEWPSGTVQEFQNVATRQIFTATEPSRLTASLSNGVPQISIRGGRGLGYEVDSSSNLTTWMPIGTATITNSNGTALVTDTNPPAADQRFYRAVLR